jgi:hypothetical protein
MPSKKGLGLKNRNFEGFFPWKEAQKTIFVCGAHGYYIISVGK